MRIDIISSVPDLLASPLNESILKRAQEKGLVEIVVHNLHDYAHDRRDGGHDEEHYRVVERFARQDALEPVVLVHVGRVCRYRSSGRSAPGRKMMSFVLPGLRGISRPRSSV